MNPLVLRAELPPDDAVVVVRGGEMNSAHVRASAQDSFDDFGMFTISVSLALSRSASCALLIGGSSATARSVFRRSVACAARGSRCKNHLLDEMGLNQ